MLVSVHNHTMRLLSGATVLPIITIVEGLVIICFQDY